MKGLSNHFLICHRLRQTQIKTDFIMPIYIIGGNGGIYGISEVTENYCRGS